MFLYILAYIYSIYVVPMYTSCSKCFHLVLSCFSVSMCVCGVSLCFLVDILDIQLLQNARKYIHSFGLDPVVLRTAVTLG